MVNDKLSRDTKPSNDLIENEMHGCLTIGFDSGHSLYPFCEIINSHYDMMMLPAESGFQSLKSTPHLVGGPMVIIGCNGEGCKHIFCVNIWPGWHRLTALTQSLKMNDQKYPSLKIF